MATTVPIPAWKQCFRVAPETAFGVNTATADWNIGGNGGGASGWRDMTVTPDTVVFTPTVNPIFPTYAASKRGMNQAAPVAGANAVDWTAEMPLYPELIDPFLYALMGSVARTPTVGTAALVSTAYASVSVLDTQPDGTEVLKFVVASSTDATGAILSIIQNAVTVETIDFGTNGGTVDGDYYSKGAYDGSVNAITFSTAGTMTGGLVVISGVDSVSNVFTVGTSPPPTLKLEEGGQPRGATNSNYYTGAAVATMDIAFDRTAADGMITVTTTGTSKFPVAATAGTFANDAKNFYNPLQAWTATITKDGNAFDKMTGLTLSMALNNQLFAVSSGNQDPSGAFAGASEITGTITVLAEDATEWDLFTGQTVGDYEITFTSSPAIVDTDKWTFVIELSELYVENYTESVTDGLFSTDLAFRTTQDASDDVVKITSVSRMPV